MARPQPLRPLTPGQYLAAELGSEIRHEYIEGQLYAMAGAGERHNRIALNLALQLRLAARGGTCGVFISDMKVRIDQGERFYYPDVALVCDTRDRDEYFKDHPCLIAEVLSPTTEETDRREKWLAYRHIPELRYYLLVHSQRPEITFYHRAEDDRWEIGQLDPGEVLEVHCADAFGATLRFEDLYEDVSWPDDLGVGSPAGGGTKTPTI